MRDRIAEVCRDFPAIRALLTAHGDLAPLDALLDALREQADPARPLERLDGAVREAEIARSPYKDTGAPSHHGPTVPAGWSELPVQGRRAEAVFLCPAGACSRSWLPAAHDTAPPVCSATGAPLRWERI
ncbi:hypothetical protein D7319_14650 [Streptomyces radicis]|uniref:Uncharacterized protein n=1 Tax=Streptomyces radicis TaxID=1750517 RepID=A0A3A9W6Y6_9ACTN|nr:hypothetical protein D7319_14650 [Streptomyces radicis]RKN21788.1 hypothetical protein D7318_15605 [Streptomyces radicis]